MAATEFKQREQRDNLICGVANQKGGVGKSSLTILLAHYMSIIGRSAVVIDCDTQLSVTKIHKECLDKHKGKEVIFNCYAYPKLDNKDVMEAFMADVLYHTESDFIIDTPGNLSQEGLVPVLTSCKIIICPFTYDEASVYSTMNFVISLEKMCREAEKNMPLLYFVLNRIQPNWGKKEEFKLWDETDKWLGRYGKVTPRIVASPEVPRVDTLVYNRRQHEIVKPCFDFILNDYNNQAA